MQKQIRWETLMNFGYLDFGTKDAILVIAIFIILILTILLAFLFYFDFKKYRINRKWD